MVTALFIITLLPLLWIAVFSGFQYWYQSKTLGDRYFKLSLAEKKQFITTLQNLGKVFIPLLQLTAKHLPRSKPPSCLFQGVSFPAASCNEQSLNAALHFKPQTQDIIVATAMKAGTTWLQNIVFELLQNGQGDLSDSGFRHLYAASPWLETGKHASVSLHNAARLGDKGRRLIKTHLPAELCPWAMDAKFIYLARDPVASFTSCQHFLQQLTGPFCPGKDTLLDWFLSDQMWWGDWPSHVAGWYQRSGKHSNVLFLNYADLQKNPHQHIARIAQFLDIATDEKLINTVAEKTSKRYMATHEMQFSMAPPTLFSAATQAGFISGERSKISPEDAERIRKYCKQALQRHHLTLQQVLSQPDI